jgi:pyruvate formate lyase activating enzyme
MHKSVLFDRLQDNYVQCRVCQRRCTIAPESTGFCKTRKNVNGELYSLIYGRVSSIRVSPIEVKPMFHYHPGSTWLSLGSLGCSFRCPGCQNWEISHANIEKELPSTQYLSPEGLVQLALSEGCTGISWTYNEPTLWLEYTLDAAKMAKEQGLLTNYVTNGYITEEAMDLLGPHLDAYRVDVKGFSPETYKKIANTAGYKGILDIIKRAKYKWGMHVELITNLIPGYNDNQLELHEMAQWIAHVMGPDTPWHVTRFVPHHRLSHIPYTPIPNLEQARQIGIDEGLQFVYLGNVPGHPAENTYCPQCGALLIERRNYDISSYHLRGDQCAYCHATIPGCFE